MEKTMTEKIQKLKSKIESCKTPLQVRKLLRKNGIEIYKDDNELYDTEDFKGTFSIWLDETTRIYQRRRGSLKEIKVQEWHKVDMTPSGIPCFCPSGKCDLFDNLII